MWVAEYRALHPRVIYKMITLKPINDGVIDEFCRKVKQTRDVGIVRCNINELIPALDGFVNGGLQSQFNVDLTTLVDNFIKTEGLIPLKNSWFEVNEETATWVLECILSQDLAYNAPLPSKDKARYFTRQLITLVKSSNAGERIRFFTNGKAVPGPAMYDLTMRHMNGWNPATEATFDSGVVIVSRNRIGMIWVADED